MTLHYFLFAGDWGGENRLNEMVQKRIDDDDISRVYMNFCDTNSNMFSFGQQAPKHTGLKLQDSHSSEKRTVFPIQRICLLVSISIMPFTYLKKR